MLLILVRWRQSNAQDATAKKPAEEFGFNRLGQPWRNCIKCRGRERNTNKTKIVDKKSEIQEAFDHAHQLLMNDLFLENYFIYADWKAQRQGMIEIPVDDKPEPTN